MQESHPEKQCREPDCCGGIDRRQFVKASGLGLATALGVTSSLPAIAGPFDEKDVIDHFVPLDKKLRPEWVQGLFEKGSRTWYSGDELKMIGMPIGGICAGQLYLTGDGRLSYWGIFNQNVNSGYGQVNYQEGRRPTQMVVKTRELVDAPQVDQGFAVQVRAGGTTQVRALNQGGFPEVRFCGEYPLAHVVYDDDDFPLRVELEAFSPFVPLNSDDSALPATVLNYTLQNTSDDPLEVTLAGWLENAAMHYGRDVFAGAAQRTNKVVSGDGLTAVLCGLRVAEEAPAPERDPVVFADFEASDYGEWQVEGEAFGSGPARGTLPRQQRVSGYRGQGLVNTYLGENDQKQGKLISPSFKIDRPFISFLVGGGGHEGTCMQLLVDGEVVRTAAGSGKERLEARNWNVRDLQGKQAHLEIVDSESGAWGHVNIDQIEFRDSPMQSGVRDLRAQPDFGTLGLAVLGDEAVVSSVELPDGALPEVLFAERDLASAGEGSGPLHTSLRAALGATIRLDPGQQKTVPFVVSWCMPNMYRGDERVGNRYAQRFTSAADVSRYVAGHYKRLVQQTRLWHDTYYDSSLPYWLLDRLHSTVGNLATNTCQWWSNGRFWAYEGCGCCHGTCGHVWNYEHAMARLFPDLERSVREMQDFAAGVGLVEETGEIRFRGEGWGIWAGDSQGGYILKAYREHQMSADDEFLKSNWPHIKQAVQFLIDQDGDADGLIEGRQHQTYDQDYYGANTMVGSLYLGALRAAEAMAGELGEEEFAVTCRRICEAGQQNSVDRLFNGEYFIQEVDLEKHPEWQYADGCLADQMFGQGWAHQVGLGYLYPPETVTKTLASIWKYCWAPDIGLQNEQHAAARWFAYAGEAGLFTCTWPQSKHLGPKSTRYRNEIWTGIEYQVANHMAYEGMLTEALAMCRAVHDRYHPRKRNPFNEIECGDHYARALASWGVLVSLAGFEYHGPKQHVAIAPRMTPESFRCVFTAAEGWGTIDQQREGDTQIDTLEVKWGRLRLRSVTLELPLGRTARTITANGVEVTFTQQDQRVALQLSAETTVVAGQNLQIQVVS